MILGEVYFSRRWKEMLGFSEEEIASNLDAWDRLVHPDDKIQAYANINHHLSGNTEQYQNEHRLLCKDGKYKWILARGQVMQRDTAGKPLRMIGTHTDITPYKQLEQALASEKQRAQYYLDVVGVMVVALNRQGEVGLLNREGEKVLGWPEAELLGQSWFESCLPQEDSIRVRDYFNQLMAGEVEPIESYENSVVNRAGEQRLIAWHTVLLLDEQGNIEGVLSAGTDVTDQRQTERALQRSQKMEAIGQLSGGVAHDFNNLLGIIIGNLDLLANQSKGDTRILSRIETAIQAALRGSDLTRRLLTFSRQQPETVKTTDINSVIRGMAELFRRSLTPEIKLDLLLSDDLWLTKIDDGELQDVLLNLVINARDAMSGRGTLTIETCNKVLDEEYMQLNPDLPQGDYLLLTVSDNGSGMSTEIQEHVFDPFFTTKAPGKGTGLGLAQVYGFCKRSRGMVNLYSEPGSGTTFRLYLPRVIDTQKVAAPSTHKEQGPLPRGSETILLVDDEVDLVNTTGTMLEELGYRTYRATSGVEALASLTEHPDITLLFSDVVMPGGVDGYQLAKEAEQHYPDIKILLTSGYTARASQNNGNSGYELLVKPYRDFDLAHRIREILDRKD